MPFPAFLKRSKFTRSNIADNAHDTPKKKKAGWVRRLLERSELVHDDDGRTTGSDSVSNTNDPSPLPEAGEKPLPRPPSAVNTLNHVDIENLFSGAPDFSISTWLHGQHQPQAIFSKDATLDISDVSDHTMLDHPSFSACTLRPHLPLPGNYGNGDPQSDRRHEPDGQEKWNQARFDIGVFEMPNMLSAQGKERGTVGWGHFLGLPVADALRTIGDDDMRQDQSYDRGQSSDESRTSFIIQGPETWRHIGLRDVKMEVLSERLRELSSRQEAVREQPWNSPVRDHETSEELYADLFTKLLYPTSKAIGVGTDDPYSLKVQLESLVTVLGAEGVWIDFSLVEWRIRLGQVLWTTANTVDGKHATTHGGSCLEPVVERKWLLLQVLLACELLIRLDAVVKTRINQVSGDLHITSNEVHHFDKLRSRKVNWDLVLARRFLDNVRVEEHLVTSSDSLVTSTAEHSRMCAWSPLAEERLPSSTQDDQPGDKHDRSDKQVDAVLIPRHPQRQLSGLLHFAKAISWPNLDEFIKRMTGKLVSSSSVASSPAESVYATPFATPSSTRSTGNAYFPQASRPVMHRQSTQRSMRLQRPKSTLATDPGGASGWLSRSWLTGLILPGEVASHVLISTLLENDPIAVEHLGDSANLYGGFIYGEKSWWSKACVVGRVLAGLEGSSECMGWIVTDLKPTTGNGETVGEGWVDIYSQTLISRGKPRIEEGTRVAQESSVLGPSGKDSSALSEDFTLPLDERSSSPLNIRFERLVLKPLNDTVVTDDGVEEFEEPQPCLSTSAASVTFIVHHRSKSREKHTSLQTATFTLSYDVQFVTSFPCHPPRGRSLGDLVPPSLPPTRLGSGDHLPGHLLHNSYRYCHKSLADLDGASPPSTSQDERREVWIIDGRCGPDADVLARAWCAENGQNAIVSRITRTCISCSIREASGIGVSIVIRV
ncbi:MAG: hypothetical protein M1830_001759 [Pleopsidium flavum]|nr:MAG: hypothetical protein M1830_001759 [Pleopsidium flavum]